MSPPRIRSAILPAILAFAIGPWAAAEAQEKRFERTVTVSAAGQVSAEPDIARISTGVVTEAATARDALTRNSDAMAKLIAGLKDNGIDAKDIQTSSFSIDPRYNNPLEGQTAVITGYRVANQVEVTARDLERLGEVMDSLVVLGANQMNGLTFDVSKAETLKDDARKEAIANALRRAKLYAAAAGAEVGEVIAIAEDAAQFQPVEVRMDRAMKAEAVPIERGSQTLEARVTVTWSLK
jgi:uncharacterized protein YggE